MKSCAVRWASAFAVVFCSSVSIANTVIVDASGATGSFTDIQSAINASQPGDVLLVVAGSYAPFTLPKGLTIVGQGAVVVGGLAHVTAIPAGQRAVLLALQPQDVVVDNCAGPVVVQAMHGARTLNIALSNDVRLRDAQFDPPPPATRDAATLASSRVEIVGSTLTGSRGYQYFNNEPLNDPMDGGRGLVLTSASKVHVTSSSMFGGCGGDTLTVPPNSSPPHAGSGGTAVSIAGSELELVASLVNGGCYGQCWNCGSDCDNDGGSGFGIQIVGPGGTDLYSRSTVFSPQWYYGVNCVQFSGMAFVGSGHVNVVPPDPDLGVAGTPAVGNVLTFTLNADPGSTATLWFGRSLVVQPTTGVEIEVLTPKARVFALGVVPASGQVQFHLTIPSYLAPGFVFCAQAEIALSGSGQIRRTNSLPIVVR